MSVPVPNEILSEIFLCSLPAAPAIPASHFPRPAFVKPSPTTAPLLLCGVCTQWRCVALATPKLWTSLDPRLISDPRLIHRWMQRTGKNAPLSLSLRPSGNGITTPNHMSILFPEIHRCQHLEIVGSFTPKGLPLPPSLPLETVSVTLDDDGIPSAAWFSALLSGSPQLTRLHWDGPNAMAPWAQLTYLSIHPSTPDALLGLLPQLGGVVELHIGRPRGNTAFSLFQDAVPPVVPPVVPNVTTFSIDRCAGGKYFAFCTLPQLRHLILVEAGHSPTMEEYLRNLLERSDCHLESLEIQAAGYDTFRHYIHHPAVSPSLTRLAISSLDLAHFLQAMQPQLFGTPDVFEHLPPVGGAEHREHSAGLGLLRGIDLCFTIAPSSGIGPAGTTGVAAEFIHSHLPSLTVLDLDLEVYTEDELESFSVTTSRGGFKLTTPT
ncbi:hypothetical protein C8R46DRAFT_1212242 [Mycena filopes]|nr:hypothetical protein C8R46DRAFT_1212242 [Mycena filopes]